MTPTMTTALSNGDALSALASAMLARPRKRKALWDIAAPGHIAAPIETLKTANAALIASIINQSLTLHSPASLLPSSTITRPGITASLAATHALANSATASKLDRRIYVGSLSYDITEDTIAAIFAPFGAITKVDMPKEPGTSRSKGFCFIEFERQESAQAAQMTMNGVSIKGRPMKIGKPTGGGSGIDHSQSLAASFAAQGLQTPQQMAAAAANIAAGNGATGYGYGGAPAVSQPVLNGQSYTALNIPSPSQSQLQPPSSRVLVSNLHPLLNESEVSDLFSNFGTIKSKEYDAANKQCVIEYEDPNSGELAVQSMDNYQFLEYTLKCQVLLPPAPAPAPVMVTAPQPIAIPQLPAHLQPQAQPPPQLPLVIPTLPPYLTNPPPSQPVSLRNEEGLSISSQSQRASIMSKLASSRSSHAQSLVIVLTNLVNANQIDSELENDVREECQKFGQVRRIVVQPNYQTNAVRIFVEFGESADSARALESLNGRFFAGRIVQAHYFPQQKFDAGVYDD